MKPSFVPSRIDILQTGTVARQCLAPNQRGNVLAAFSKAIYFLTDEAELFWIATADSPMHRRCAQIHSPLPGLVPGSLFRVEDQHLIIDPDFIFDLKQLPPWSAPPIDSNHVLQSTELPAQIESVFSKINLSNAKGFGQFIPNMVAISRNQSFLSTLANPLLCFAQPYVMNMAYACLQHQSDEIPKSMDALIGLGLGLTPSGDDFIGGVLFAHHSLRTAYPAFTFMDFVIAVEAYRSRTHPISFTLLQDLACGHAVAPLHQILNNLLLGRSFASIYPIISQLIQIGSSTGWDLLSGLLTGLLVTYRQNNLISSPPLNQRMQA